MEYIGFLYIPTDEASDILRYTINFLAEAKGMSEEQKQIVETLKRREQDIEIMELLLKHNLTKKRAEYKLMIMYYKACNMMSKAKLMMSGINENDVRKPHIPQTPKDINQVCRWYEQFERRASDL